MHRFTVSSWNLPASFGRLPPWSHFGYQLVAFVVTKQYGEKGEVSDCLYRRFLFFYEKTGPSTLPRWFLASAIFYLYYSYVNSDCDGNGRKYLTSGVPFI